MQVNLSHQHNYRFPWQTGNHFELLIDGPVFFSAMLDDIHNARDYILLEMYLVEPGHISQRFFKALSDAARRNVAVYLLLDDFGSRTLTDMDNNQLINNKVKLCFYNPLQLHHHKLLLFRDHRKLLVIDGHTAFVGGAGFVDDFDSIKHPQTNWRENMVRIQGPNVLQWQSLFTDNWARWSEEKIELKTDISAVGQQKGRVAMTAGPRFLEIKRSFLNQVRRAEKRVWMSTAYFVPSQKLRRALRRTALRGIDVRLLIPGTITDHPMVRYLTQRYYSRMLKDGIRIFEYQPRFMHAKIVLCDSWTTLGSCNIDRWNLRWNLDANQEIEDADFAKSIIDMFETDFSNSREITLDQWHKRSLFRKINIWFWGALIRMVDIISIRLKIIRHWKRFRNKGQ
jgi:cardiolipin synthase A/B